MQKLRLALLFSILAFIVATIGISTAKSQEKPNPPMNFAAAIEETAVENFIKLTWTRDNSGPQPDAFNIYMMPEKVDTPPPDIKPYLSIRNINSMQDFKYYVQHLKPGWYSFYMTSVIFTQSGPLESDPTQIVQIEIFQQPFLSIDPIPPVNIKLGERVTIKLHVQSNLKCPINWSFDPNYDGTPPPEWATIDPISGQLVLAPDKEGTFIIAVRAVMQCDPERLEAATKIMVKVGQQGGNDAFIRFVSQPPMQVMVNTDYFYQPRIETNLNCVFNFELQGELPEGLTFDPANGAIKGIPTKPGHYSFAIRAFFPDCTPKIEAFQKIPLDVMMNTRPEPCAILTGSVAFDDGTPVPNGFVKIVSVEKSNTISGSAVNINNGEFRITLPKGIYAVCAGGNGIVTEWYEDVKEIKEATNIELNCADSVHISMVVAKLPEPKTFNASGKVVREDDGSPVGAMVEFIPVGTGFNDINGKMKPPVFATRTDEQGNYIIKLPGDNAYIAHAISAMSSVRFCDQYYSQVTSPLEADIIDMDADKTGIDFALKVCDNTKYSFGGTVVNEANEPIRSKVMAHLIKPQNPTPGNKNFVQAVETDDAGNYKFNNLLPGDYVVLSAPFEKQYIPGYFKVDDFATLLWREATVISVNDQMIDVVFEIKHKKRQGITGVAHINGTIQQKNGSIGKYGNETLVDAQPIAGAFVFVKNSANEVIDYAFSDGTGKFNLTELAQGAYTLVADKIGFNPVNYQVNTDYKDNSLVNLNLEIELMVTAVDDQTDLIQSKLQVYPAPTDDVANIKFFSNGGTANISVYNEIGEMVLSFAVDMQSGVNQFSFLTGSLANGAYFVRIKDGVQIYTGQLRILH
ncbi:MAG: carboxypeptidase regulatory-like domain-containing protein [Bacteroidota bacterium]